MDLVGGRGDTAVMQNWHDRIELIRMRSHQAGTPAFRAELARGRFTLLCPEIAVPTQEYAALRVWERQELRAFGVGLGTRKAVVVGKSAARLHGIPVLGWNEPVTLSLPGLSRPPRGQWPQGVEYRKAALFPEHVTEHHGVRVTRIIRTAVDLSRHHGVIDGIVAFDHILAMPGMTRARAEETIDQLGRMRGLQAARRALELADPRAESPIESWARAQILTAELPEVTSVELQVSVLDGRYRVDILVNGFHVVETDGDLKYDGVSTGITPEEQMRRDRERDRALTNAGIPRLHVTHADLAEGSFLGMLRDALRAHAAKAA